MNWGWRPESSFQNTTNVHARGSNAVLKKFGNWSWTGFPEEHPSSGFTAGRKDFEIACESAFENHTALELHIRQKKNDVEGLPIALKKSCAINDGFLRRINCFPEPTDSHLSMAYWTSAVLFFGKLLIAGPVIVASARFWSVDPSGRSSIQFMARSASSRMLNLARSRRSLISAHCWYCGAWIEITFALYFQSPRTFRTCHSVGTTCLRESGTNSSGCEGKLWKIHLGFLPRKRVHLQWYFDRRYCTFFNNQIFTDSGSKIRKYLPPRIWYSATARQRRYCCQWLLLALSFWW